jgi:hypothetical protein
VQTHCFICPPQTQAVHCWTGPVACDTMQMPTPATRCFICPPVDQTLATVCTQINCPTHQIHCPTQPVVCNLQPTQPVVCGVLPPSIGCQQGGAQPQHAMAMAAPAHPNTAATLCTQQPACPPHPLATLRTSWFECHTNMAGCTVHICAQAAPQAQALGPPNPHTVGGGAISQCWCPPTQWHCAPQATVATVCTLVGCPTQPVVCGLMPPSFGCQQGGAQPQHAMAMAAHPNTAATLCTQHPACPPNTVNTPCATFVCPTLGVCPTVAACTPNGVFTPFGR